MCTWPTHTPAPPGQHAGVVRELSQAEVAELIDGAVRKGLLAHAHPVLSLHVAQGGVGGCGKGAGGSMPVVGNRGPAAHRPRPSLPPIRFTKPARTLQLEACAGVHLSLPGLARPPHQFSEQEARRPTSPRSPLCEVCRRGRPSGEQVQGVRCLPQQVRALHKDVALRACACVYV